MCKLNRKNKGRRIDPCMKNYIKVLNVLLDKQFKIVACCCGHKKYPMSIIVISKNLNIPLDIVSGKNLSRKKRFYLKDKQGYYYIPETLGKCREAKK